MKKDKFLDILKQVMDCKNPDYSSYTDAEKEILDQLSIVTNESNQIKETSKRMQERLGGLLDILVEFAQFNFTMEIPISEEADELDGIALGLQTLGQEIEYYQKELTLSTQNLREAQEMARIGSWVVDAHTKEMNWSDEVYRIYEMDRNDSTFSALRSRYSSEDADKLAMLFDRAINFHEPYQITLRIMTNDKVKYIDAQAKPVFEEGELINITGTVMDVTDRFIAQRKLEISNIELEKKVVERTKDLEGFSYSVSHDLRAPLRSILGFSNILSEAYGDRLDDEGKRLLGIISRNASKMSTLIEELLTFSRVGVTVPDFQPIKLDELIDCTWQEALGGFFEKDKVTIQIEELPTIYGAVSLLNQVFGNLFSNALKYSSKKEEIQISVKKFNEDKNMVTLVIQDNGCGFNMKYHEKLFGVFQRLHSEDEFPGTGVGLALVKRIVDKHSGSIWAESEIDTGSKFYVSLPLVNPNDLVIH
jgi:signal transduction histidine kinase